MNYSLIRENVCDVLSHGIYDNRRAIIMPRLGIDLQTHITQNYTKGLPYDLLCKAARQAVRIEFSYEFQLKINKELFVPQIRALRFVHNKGYLHQDIKLDNFALGTVEAKKNDKPQSDQPMKDQLYLLGTQFAIRFFFA